MSPARARSSRQGGLRSTRRASSRPWRPSWPAWRWAAARARPSPPSRPTDRPPSSRRPSRPRCARPRRPRRARGRRPDRDRPDRDRADGGRPDSGRPAATEPAPDAPAVVRSTPEASATWPPHRPTPLRRTGGPGDAARHGALHRVADLRGAHPFRMLDTRNGTAPGSARSAPPASSTSPCSARGGVPASDVSAVVLNVHRHRDDDQRVHHRVAHRDHPAGGLEPQLRQGARPSPPSSSRSRHGRQGLLLQLRGLVAARRRHPGLLRRRGARRPADARASARHPQRPSAPPGAASVPAAASRSPSSTPAACREPAFSAVVLNVTAVSPTSAGYVSVYPTA